VYPLIVDALGSGREGRRATLDAVGAGPRAVAGVLELRGLEPRIAVAEELLGGALDLGGRDLLLISAMTIDLPTVRRIASRWRVVNPDAPIILGGPVASDPSVLIRVGGDVAVVGEGEKTLEELLDLMVSEGALPRDGLSRIRGVAYIDGGDVRVNPLRPVMRREEYDRFMPSTKVIWDYPLYYAARVYVEVVRGCSNYLRPQIEECSECDLCKSGDLRGRYHCPMGIPPGCGYCSVPSLYGPPRSRSVHNILREASELLARGVRRIVLSAPDILDYGRDLLVEPEPLTDPREPEPNYESLETLLSALTDLEEFKRGEASLMAENVKPSLVTERATRLLGRYLRGTPINIGFETGSESHSRLIGRPSTPRECLKAVRRLRRAGLRPHVYFIHGLPGQSPETVEATAKAMWRCVEAGAEWIILYRFTPLPMSAFAEMPRAPPAAKDPLSLRLRREASKANKALKRRWIGRRLRVIVDGRYPKDRRLHVAYPMPHGPVVLVEGAEGLKGRLVEAVVTSILSERLVKGVID
jgi:radical SAM superfamily enzyme YgiQ (UPF0313 family)